MGVWHAYLDESYNSKTFCVGCFLARAADCDDIARSWSERLAYESRISANRGCSAISRYHASDCASLKREFSEKNGWSIARQIRLTKRLSDILGGNRTTGIVVGGSIEDVQKHCGPGSDPPKELLYSLCFRMCLLGIVSLMRLRVVDARVRVFYERGEFAGVAKESFDLTKDDQRPEYKCLCSADAAGWEECVPLQAADFLAYEGFRRIDGSLKGKNLVRKSLQALIRNANIIVEHFQQENFADIVRMIENQKAGRPRHEGVESGLHVCHGDIPYLPR
ncbi:MAG: hypothetical protein ACLQKA_07895 [Bryobacteraceae bacterium]